MVCEPVVGVALGEYATKFMSVAVGKSVGGLIGAIVDAERGK